MTSWAERRRGEDATWQHDRVMSRLVPCEDCDQPKGEDCINLRTGLPLEHQAAHARRIEQGKAKAAADVGEAS